jgi:hypothetical protein
MFYVLHQLIATVDAIFGIKRHWLPAIGTRMAIIGQRRPTVGAVGYARLVGRLTARTGNSFRNFPGDQIFFEFIRGAVSISGKTRQIKRNYLI